MVEPRRRRPERPHCPQHLVGYVVLGLAKGQHMDSQAELAQLRDAARVLLRRAGRPPVAVEQRRHALDPAEGAVFLLRPPVGVSAASVSELQPAFLDGVQDVRGSEDLGDGLDEAPVGPVVLHYEYGRPVKVLDVLLEVLRVNPYRLRGRRRSVGVLLLGGLPGELLVRRHPGRGHVSLDEGVGDADELRGDYPRMPAFVEVAEESRDLVRRLVHLENRHGQLNPHCSPGASPVPRQGRAPLRTPLRRSLPASSRRCPDRRR